MPGDPFAIPRMTVSGCGELHLVECDEYDRAGALTCRHRDQAVISRHHRTGRSRPERGACSLFGTGDGVRAFSRGLPVRFGCSASASRCSRSRISRISFGDPRVRPRSSVAAAPRSSGVDEPGAAVVGGLLRDRPSEVRRGPGPRPGGSAGRPSATVPDALRDDRGDHSARRSPRGAVARPARSRLDREIRCTARGVMSDECTALPRIRQPTGSPRCARPDAVEVLGGQPGEVRGGGVR
ncbi:hypothetical protein FHR84_000684 [Actinopolyspora biskrensis]|uniref:Uncharacterized protein n=1 Tax=Actinopolyspora biskrensis TaxID=1470178 RepID=A0A852YTE5_9ACTN|nr:hypothetical protein [Actinopolyspora biskrensis]